MVANVVKKHDLDLQLFKDVSETLKQMIYLERIRLYKNHYGSLYIQKKIFERKKQINGLIKRLAKRLKIILIDEFLINYDI